MTIDGGGSIAVNGSTVYMSSKYSNTIYEFNSDKRAWVSSIKCDRKSFAPIAALFVDNNSNVYLL